MEKFIRWEAPELIKSNVYNIDLSFKGDDLTLLLIFNQSDKKNDFNLKVTFECVRGFTCHDEYEHPNYPRKTKAPPVGVGPNKSWTFPCLIVENSDWQKRLDESPMCFSWDSIHYQFISLNNVVDVLAEDPPLIEKVDAFYEINGK